ncbi:MAG: lasso peptide isopeptide bond-forming cyclase, partial [Chloroflexi bacterium]
LILAAYQRWGEACPEHLIGDFAFAIWDANRQSLFCARDIVGDRPFYYYLGSGLFIFGSEAKALFCHPAVPRRLNESMVGFFLTSVIPDIRLTFYEDVLRLPPAHRMTVNAGGARIERYWSPDLSRELRLKSDAEYAAAFRDVFTKAVRCRMRSAFPLGSELSGGLDSSAVTSMARQILQERGQLPLKTFSVVYNQTPEADEREYINAVIEQGGLEPHFVALDDVGPLHDPEGVFHISDETFTSFTVFIPWAINRRVSESGVRVMLTGLDGDTTVSYGIEYLNDLARADRWGEFAAEARALAGKHQLLSLNHLVQTHGFDYLTALAQQGKWGAFARGVNGLAGQFKLPRGHLWRQYGVKPITPRPVLNVWHKFRGGNGANGATPVEHYFVNPQFSGRVALDAQIAEIERREQQPFQPARQFHANAITADALPFMYEWANRSATAFGVEARHPFGDRRLIEFCLSLPPAQKLHNGWTRVVMRRAMDGILADKVCWRGGKTLNTPAFSRGLREIDGERVRQAVEKPAPALGEYIDLNTLQLSYRQYRETGSTDDEINLWKAATLSMWLEQSGVTA